MLQLAFVGGLTGEYVDFTTAQHAALRMLAERTGRALSDDDARGVVDAMSSLPPHPEVGEALTPLYGLGGADGGQERGSGHGQGDVGVPGVVAADLILVQGGPGPSHAGRAGA
jgi:hypothetical protein